MKLYLKLLSEAMLASLCEWKCVAYIYVNFEFQLRLIKRRYAKQIKGNRMKWLKQLDIPGCMLTNIPFQCAEADK